MTDVGETADPPRTPSYALSIALFGRALGLVTLLAFVSLHAQVFGLFGEGGIDPMARRVSFLAEHFGSDAFTAAPSVFFFIGGSNVALGAVCFVGELASVLMMLGLVTGPAALVAYLAYLSFVSLGAPFIPLQWDTLLLESLVLAALVLPWSWRQSLARLREPSWVARIALWLLVARLMFASGYVKLSSGDELWSSLRALDYHFETQPLSTGLGYALHFGPRALRTFGVVLTFFVELLLPWAVPFGVVGRRIAAVGFAALMIVIGLSGNYGFFNALALALTIPLVDDAWLERCLPKKLRAKVGRVANEESTRRRHARDVLPGLQAFLGALALLSTLGARVPAPDAIESWHLASSYGLFAIMTTERPIVVFEGSDDGETWQPYDYRYQTDDPMRGPAQCFPHMPRLDWLVWFAGLGDYENNRWIAAVERGLLEARPDVLSLFRTDPFHGEPPRAVRAVRYVYRFAPPGDEAWWLRGDPEPYGPVMTRRE